MDEAYQSLLIEFDTVNGGFGRAPKFPAPHTLLFLLRYGAKHPNSRAFAMAETTLTAIRNGGIYDHLAGGIHRYSTDARWLVPHFEKMLYDQALLVMACTEAYQASGNNVYRRTVEKIIGYVLHSLRSPEGAFYVWTLREIEQLLGNGDAAIAALVFDLTAEGNYHDAERGHGFNILHRPQPLENIAASLKVPREELELRVATIASRLLKARGERARPSLDDKVLADWNGLWIAALALAGRVFDNPGWVDAAKTTLNFILSHMRSEDGGLLHRYREGEAAIPGFADDYACIIHALIELYETTFDPPLLRTAVELNQYLSAHFHDAHEGGYFTVSDTAEALIVRKKEIYDGAIPSCNSVAFMNLIRLSRLTGDAQFEERASALSRTFAGTTGLSPSAYTWFLCGLDLLEDPSHDVVIVGAEESEDTRALVSAMRSGYLPSLLILRFAPGPEAVALADLAPITRNLSMTEGKATAYVCTGHSCSRPGTNPGALAGLINVKKSDLLENM